MRLTRGERARGRLLDRGATGGAPHRERLQPAAAATCSAPARCRAPPPDQAGSLLELTQGGKEPITLPNGEKRTFLEDGDTLILRGYCEAAGATRIGLGEASGMILQP